MNDSTRGKRFFQRAGSLTWRILFWAIIACMLLLGIVFIPFVLYILFGILPILISVGMERNPERPITRSVAVMNFAGIIHAIYYNLSAGRDFTSLRNVMLDSTNWLLPFGFAAGGLLIYFITPFFLSGFIRRRAEARINELREERRELERTWGEQIIPKQE